MGDINSDLVDTREFTTNYSFKPNTDDYQVPAGAQEFKIDTEQQNFHDTCLKFDKTDEGVTIPLNIGSCKYRDLTDETDLKYDNNEYNLKPLVVVIERGFKQFKPKGTIHTDDKQKPADAQEFKIETEEHNLTDTIKFDKTEYEGVTSLLSEASCEYRDQTDETDLKYNNSKYNLKPLVVAIERGFKEFEPKGTIHTYDEEEPTSTQEFKIEIEEYNLSDTIKFDKTEYELVTSPLSEASCEYRDQTDETDLKDDSKYNLKPVVVVIERGFKEFEPKGTIHTDDEQEPTSTQEFKIEIEEYNLSNTIKFDKSEDEEVTSPLNKVNCEYRDQTDLKYDDNKYNLKSSVVVIERGFKEFEPKGTIHTDEQKLADAQEFKIEIEEHSLSDTPLKFDNTEDEEVISPLYKLGCEYRDQALNETDLQNYNEIYKLKPLVVVIERGFEQFEPRGTHSASKTKSTNSNRSGVDINVKLNTLARNSKSEQSIKSSQSNKTGCKHKLTSFSVAVRSEERKEYFQCPYCESKLTTENVLKRHIKSLHSENNIQYECDSCGYKSKRKDSLMRHIREQHSTNRKIYHCQFCEFRSKCEVSLNNHVACKHNESEEWYYCDSCDYKARVKSYLMSHRKRHEANWKVHHCQFCGHKFTKDSLRKHLTRQHAEDMKVTSYKRHSSQETRSNYENNKQDRTDFSCHFCEIKVKTKHSLKRHVYYKHSGKAEWHQCCFCEYKTIHKSHLKSHINCMHNEEVKLYRCDSCNFETKHKSNLIAHFTTKHTANSKMHKCQFCEYTSKHKSVLRRHIQRKHTENPRIYQCQSCDYKTKDSGSLKMHIRRMHSNDIPLYKCEFCELKRNKYALATHIKLIHGKDFEIYQCKECEYSTKHKSNLKYHIKSKHTNDYAEMYQCELCEYKAEIKSQLSTHFKGNHTKSPVVHQCQHCGYKATRKFRLKEHFNAKHSEMPEWYRCNLCSFKTKTRNNLKRHIRSDHDEIFQCKFCEYKTPSSHNMTVHMKTAHEEKGQYFTCDLCGYKTVTKAWLEGHFKITHDTKPEWFYCNLCDYKAKLKSYLINHIHYKHKKYSSQCQCSGKVDCE